MSSTTSLESTSVGPEFCGDIDTLRLPALVGRGTEMGEIGSLIDDQRVTLLTVTGPAGVGKSRIVREVLAGGVFDCGRLVVDVAEAKCRDDVWDAAVTAAQNGDLVGSGVDDASPDVDSVRDVFATVVSDTRVILVLDNCDRVAEAIAHDIPVLLGRCPNLVVVVTSRVVVNLHREFVVTVRPLPTRSEPAPGRTLTSPAAQMLLAGIDSRYRGSAPNRSILEDIALEVDGVPLALELAANMINRVGPARTLQHLRAGASLPPLPYVDVPARHRSLYDAVGWGVDRLEADTMDVLLHLSLCQSDSELETISHLVGREDTEVSGMLSTLVAHSLLQRFLADDGQPGYTLLRPVRTYCHLVLDADDSRGSRIRRVHVDRVCEVALDIVDSLNHPDRVAAALSVAERNVTEFAAVVADLVGAGAAQRAVALAVSLEEIWIRLGYLPRIERTLCSLIDAVDVVYPVDPAVAYAAELLGGWALRSGRSQRAIDLLTRSASHYDLVGDTKGAHRVATSLGIASLEVGRYDRARDHLGRAGRDSHDVAGARDGIVDVCLAALPTPADFTGDERDPSPIEERIRGLDTEADRLRACNTVARVRLRAGDAVDALQWSRRVLRTAEPERHLLETITAVAGCAAAYEAAGTDVAEFASTLFGAVHQVAVAHAIPQPESSDARPAHLVRPDTAWELGDIVAYAMSGPALRTAVTSTLDVLTARQREIAILVAGGLTNRMIASKLGIAEWTVINHLRQVMARLECPSRLHVALVVTGEPEPVAQ